MAGDLLPSLNELAVPQRLEDIRFLAKVYGWVEMYHDERRRFMHLHRKGKVLKIHYLKMTVISVLDHPIRGRNQLVRKRVDMVLLEEIFNDPRVHTDIGYH